MLVLTRKQNEEIVIGDNIRVTVVQIKGNSIRLGIDAPRDVRIVRSELPPKAEPTKAEPQRAEVTIVFSDDRNQPGNQTKAVPFQEGAPNSETAGRRSSSAVAATSPVVDTTEARTEAPDSISFQQRLPEALHRNRLQEIVNAMAQR